MIHEIISQDYNSNSYILTGETPILIDPGLPSNPYLEKALSSLGIEIGAVVLTHCHYDHIGNCKGFPPVMVHKNDAEAVRTGSEKTVYMHFSSTFDGFPLQRELEEGDRVSSGNHTLKVIHTPGHTDGCICLLDEDSGTLFSGDTWFSTGIGRTDLPSGSFEALHNSFQKLKDVDAHHICPGHGPSFENNIDIIGFNYFGGI